MHWARVADGVDPGGLIQGYSLHVDDGFGGRFTEVFNSVGVSRLVSEHLVTGLTLSLTYRFYVIAYNYNGMKHGAASLASSITEV